MSLEELKEWQKSCENYDRGKPWQVRFKQGAEIREIHVSETTAVKWNHAVRFMKIKGVRHFGTARLKENISFCQGFKFHSFLHGARMTFAGNNIELIRGGKVIARTSLADSPRIFEEKATNRFRLEKHLKRVDKWIDIDAFEMREILSVSDPLISIDVAYLKHHRADR